MPDHIRLYESSSAYRSAAHGSGAAGSGSRISGVFCAPQIHTRNTTIMQAALMPTGIPLHCITVEELLELLLSKDRALIETTLG